MGQKGGTTYYSWVNVGRLRWLNLIHLNLYMSETIITYFILLKNSTFNPKKEYFIYYINLSGMLFIFSVGHLNNTNPSLYILMCCLLLIPHHMCFDYSSSFNIFSSQTLNSILNLSNLGSLQALVHCYYSFMPS